MISHRNTDCCTSRTLPKFPPSKLPTRTILRVKESLYGLSNHLLSNSYSYDILWPAKRTRTVVRILQRGISVTSETRRCTRHKYYLFGQAVLIRVMKMNLTTRDPVLVISKMWLVFNIHYEHKRFKIFVQLSFIILHCRSLVSAEWNEGTGNKYTNCNLSVISVSLDNRVVREVIDQITVSVCNYTLPSVR